MKKKPIFLFAIIKSVRNKNPKTGGQNINLVHIAVTAALVLLVPFIVMQFIDEVNWGLADFVIIGGLVFSTGFAYVFAATKFSGTRQRVAIGFVLAAAFLFTWAELAVGVFGSPIAGS